MARKIAKAVSQSAHDSGIRPADKTGGSCVRHGPPARMPAAETGACEAPELAGKIAESKFKRPSVQTAWEIPNAVVQYTDSGFKAKTDTGLSVRGLVSLRVDAGLLKSPSKGPCHVLEFVSKSQRHVTRSTFSSELFAGTDAVDAGLLTRLALHELQHGQLDYEKAKKILEGQLESNIQLHAVLDAKSVTSAVTAPYLKVPAEPSLLVHLHWLRQLLQKGVMQGLWWTDTRDMLADGLTKGSVSREALEALANGWFEVRHELTNEALKLEANGNSG